MLLLRIKKGVYIMDGLTKTRICFFILLSMFLIDYIIKKKQKNVSKKYINIAKITTALLELTAVIVVVFVL